MTMHEITDLTDIREGDLVTLHKSEWGQGGVIQGTARVTSMGLLAVCDRILVTSSGMLLEEPVTRIQRPVPPIVERIGVVYAHPDGVIYGFAAFIQSDDSRPWLTLGLGPKFWIETSDVQRFITHDGWVRIDEGAE